jgi:hypothetical protein
MQTWRWKVMLTQPMLYSSLTSVNCTSAALQSVDQIGFPMESWPTCSTEGTLQAESAAD